MADAATLEAAPVEVTTEVQGSDALADFLAEDESTPEPVGDADEAPATEEAQAVEPSEEEQPDQNPLFTVKVRGEELEVPLDELLKGYSRTEDYKAKTAEVAELRRQSATEYADKLEQTVSMFEALDPVLSQTKDLDWAALAQQDPALYVSVKAQHDQRVDMLRQAYGEIDQIRGAEQQRALQAKQADSELEGQLLIQAMPDLADPVKMSSFATDVGQYLKGVGFSDADISDTDNHLALIIADKARKWDELQNAKKTVETKKVGQRASPTLAPRPAESPRATPKPGPHASDETRRAWITAQLSE